MAVPQAHRDVQMQKLLHSMPLYTTADTFVSCTTGQEFKTMGVVYLYTYGCPLNYVGKIKRQLIHRVRNHLGNIKEILLWHVTYDNIMGATLKPLDSW